MRESKGRCGRHWRKSNHVPGLCPLGPQANRKLRRSTRPGPAIARTHRRLNVGSREAALNVGLWVFPAAAHFDERTSAYGQSRSKPGFLGVGLSCHWLRPLAPSGMGASECLVSAERASGSEKRRHHAKRPGLGLRSASAGYKPSAGSYPRCPPAARDYYIYWRATLHVSA